VACVWSPFTAAPSTTPRRFKPSIPLVATDGIPIHDELEPELPLG
jgi:hypothetical protein